MNETVLYSIQTILSAGMFIIIYRLFVRNTNAYNWNRFYLLSTMVLSLFLPHINISKWFTIEQPIIYYGSLINLDQPITITANQPVQNAFNLSELIMTGYWVIAIILFLRFGWGILRILELAKNDDYKKSGKLRLYPIQRKTTFSFFNYIFIQPEHWEQPSIDYIILHEQAHVKLYHSLDNLMTELLLVFGWFNPFYYVYRSDLHLLHECQADQSVINSGFDKTTYHQLLLNEVSGNLTYIIVNQFSYSLIKRRFKMISKNKQSRLAGFRILLAIPTTFALLMLFSFTSMDKTKSLLENNIMKTVRKTINLTPSVFTKDGETTLQNEKDFNAHYPGGYAAWTELVKQNTNLNLNIPSNVQGKEFAMIRFFVSENGTVKDPKVVLSMNDAYDKEALRMISLMPKLAPTIKDGKTVSVVYVLPVKLALQQDPQKIDQDEKPLLKVDKNPEFKGGYQAMLKYLQANLHYPATAKIAGIQGTIFVQFVISKTGKISNVKILRGIENSCDEEAMRVVKAMPDWTPGENNGKPVPVMFQIPVKFQLSQTAAVVEDKNEEKPLLVVEQNPEFAGGYNGMLKYLKDSLKYPDLAKNSGIQGTVFVQFVVNKTGALSNVKILRGIGGGCDEEAVRVVQAMPKWIPGRQNGIAVPVMFQIPVKFQLAAKQE
jgi:TonB family protein